MKVLPFLLLLTLSITQAKAQKFDDLFVTVLSETISFPFKSYTPIHPGVEVGTNFWKKENAKFTQQANVFIGGYYHNKYETGLYLRGEYLPSLLVKETIGISLPIGVGYQHTFYAGQVHEQTADGTWQTANQTGEPNLIASFGLGLTYLKLDKIQPYIRHENMINFPLADDVQVIKTFLKLGVCIKLEK